MHVHVNKVKFPNVLIELISASSLQVRFATIG